MPDFVKYHGKEVSADWQRVNYFYRLSCSQGYFLFPRPLRQLGEKIVYERFENLQILPNFLTQDNCQEILFKSGQALAAIHQADAAGDSASLHSDFAMINVAWHPEKRLPIIFDPLPARFYPYKNYKGSRYFDLAQFIASIFSINYFICVCCKSPRLPILMVRAFIDGYEQESGITLKQRRLLAFSARIHHDYYRYRINETRRLSYIAAVPIIVLLKLLMLQVLRWR